MVSSVIQKKLCFDFKYQNGFASNSSTVAEHSFLNPKNDGFKSCPRIWERGNDKNKEKVSKLKLAQISQNYTCIPVKTIFPPKIFSRQNYFPAKTIFPPKLFSRQRYFPAKTIFRQNYTCFPAKTIFPPKIYMYSRQSYFPTKICKNLFLDSRILNEFTLKKSLIRISLLVLLRFIFYQIKP